MERRMIVSGGDLLRVFSLPGRSLLCSAPLAGAGAVCCNGQEVFCACGREGTIFVLDARTLMIKALFAGGPGICGMVCKEQRLYVLCGEGDGVLMLDRRSGSPLVYARTGPSPLQIGASFEDGALIVAGGEGSDVTRLCPHTLGVLSRDTLPGPVYGAAVLCGQRYALCMNESLQAVLIEAGQKRNRLCFPGLPGALACDPERGLLLAAVQGGLYAVLPEGLRALGFLPLPGCACGAGSRLVWHGGDLLFLDASSGRLLALQRGCMAPVCADAADAAFLD